MDHLQLLDSYQNEMISALQASVRINSVKTDAVMTAAGCLPFGKGVDEAYRHILSLGRELGFDTFDADGYGGHIEWNVPGASKTFAIVGHIDVVPEGNGWTKGAFSGAIEDGKMYGRGTSDDKGPVFAALYAMKALKESGAEPEMNIRLIIGLDEETEKIGMTKYLEAAGMPDLGFTPDAEFPLINGEMGIMIFDLAEKLKRHSTKEGPVLRKVEGGVAPNAVPDRCRAVIAAEDSSFYDSLREKADAFSMTTGYRLSVRKTGSSVAVESTGTAAHGARPELGLNAVSIMMQFLGEISFAGDEINEFIDFYNENIGFKLHGEGLGIDFSDEESGKLIYNVGICEVNEDVASFKSNIRYPVTVSSDDIRSAIDSKLVNTNLGYVEHMDEKPVYMDISDPFAAAMIEAYRAETGDEENEPMVIGGGTYAKMFDNVLAFGMLFPGEEDRMHQADEYILLESLAKGARIYADVLKRVCID